MAAVLPLSEQDSQNLGVFHIHAQTSVGPSGDSTPRAVHLVE